MRETARPRRAPSHHRAVDGAALHRGVDESAATGSDRRGELIAAYLVESKQLVSKLVAAAAIADAPRVADLARVLQAPSAELGATALATLLERVERAAAVAPAAITALARLVEVEHRMAVRTLVQLQRQTAASDRTA